jgi:CTP-dependent riboflavin kinase
MKNDTESLCEKIKLFEEAQQRLIKAERRISALLEEIEELKMALNESLKYYTVAKYNETFHMGWDAMESQDVERNLLGYCLSRAVKIRECETNDGRFGSVNSYPIAVWSDFVERYGV